MTLSTLPSWAHRLIEEARVARLAFLDAEDHPRVLPVTFALAGEALWSAIDEKPKRAAMPARVAYLRRRPEAALIVDVYSDDWDQLAWVQLLGSVEVVEAEVARAGLEALVAKYEQYRHQRLGPLLRLEPERALSWRARQD